MGALSGGDRPRLRKLSMPTVHWDRTKGLVQATRTDSPNRPNNPLLGPFAQDAEHLATGARKLYGTHCSKWECSHRLEATSKGLHANLRKSAYASCVNETSAKAGVSPAFDTRRFVCWCAAQEVGPVAGSAARVSGPG